VVAVAVVVVVVVVVAVAVVGIKAVDDAHTRMLLILSSSLDLHARPRGDQIACVAGGVVAVGDSYYVKVARSELELCGTSGARGAPSTKIHANPRLPNTTQHNTTRHDTTRHSTRVRLTCMMGQGLVVGSTCCDCPRPATLRHSAGSGVGAPPPNGE
jgi:hypothetical protein